EMRDVIVGMSNEREVEVKPWDDETHTGLKEGERVVENPRPLLSEDSELKPGKVRSKPDEDNQGSGSGDPTRKGKKGKDGPHPPRKSGPGTNPGTNPGNGGEFIRGPAGGPAKGPDGKAFTPSPEQVQQFREKLLEKARSSTPAERRDMINQTPEGFRD